MNTTNWLPLLALIAFCTLTSAEANAGNVRTQHKRSMQMSRSDARAIVEGQRTQWNSLYQGAPAAAARQREAAAVSAKTESAPSAKADREDAGGTGESLDLLATVGEIGFAIVAIPVVVVGAVVVGVVVVGAVLFFPMQCLSVL
ncbi:MAG: hypothetical protein ACI8W8_000220 [Rhodothermales bacterium]|jgi:hypothetical protein